MSPSYLSSGLRREIHQRALGRCQYCLLSQEDAFFPHEPDHIIAEKHAGATTIENLALACFDCNRFKGSDIASIDPDSGNLVPLFNPRIQEWNKHFSLGGGLIIALTPIAAATVRLLKLTCQRGSRRGRRWHDEGAILAIDIARKQGTACSS